MYTCKWTYKNFQHALNQDFSVVNYNNFMSLYQLT